MSSTLQYISPATRDAESVNDGGMIAYNGGAVTQSATAAHSGTQSWRVAAAAGSSDSGANLGTLLGNGDSTPSTPFLTPGRTYTVDYWVFIPLGQTTTFSDSRGGTIDVFYFVSPTTTGNPGAAITTAGVWEHKNFTVAIPSNATKVWIRAYNGYAAGSGLFVYYDDISITTVQDINTVNPSTPAVGRSIRTVNSFVDVGIGGNTATKTISGYVYNAKGLTVSGATVKVFRQVDDFCVAILTSDTSGHYQLTRDASDTLTYYVLAYSVVGGTTQIHGTSNRGLVPA